jgi:hypothetical protein
LYNRAQGSSEKITLKAMKHWITKKFGIFVFVMTISRLLKRGDEYLLNSKKHPKAKRVRRALCPEVETPTFEWFCMM